MYTLYAPRAAPRRGSCNCHAVRRWLLSAAARDSRSTRPLHSRASGTTRIDAGTRTCSTSPSLRSATTLKRPRVAGLSGLRIKMADEIDGVRVRPLRVIEDHRGAVLHMLRSDWPEFDK